MGSKAHPWNVGLAGGLSLLLGLMPLGSAYAAPPTPQVPSSADADASSPGEGDRDRDRDRDEDENPDPDSGGEAQTPEAQAMELFAEGEEAYNAADYGRALEHFQDAQSLYPSAVFHYNIGQCLEALGKLEQAIVSYRAYLRSGPDDAANVERKITQLESLVKARAAEAAAETKEDVGPTPPPGEGSEGSGPVDNERKKNGVPLMATGGVLMGLGAVGLVVGGVVFGRQAQDLSNQVDDVQQGGNPEQLTLTETRDLDDRGRQAETLQIVTMSIGGVLAAAGVALIAVGVVQRKRHAAAGKTADLRLRPTLSPGRAGLGVGLTGRF